MFEKVTEKKLVPPATATLPKPEKVTRNALSCPVTDTLVTFGEADVTVGVPPVLVSIPTLRLVTVNKDWIPTTLVAAEAVAELPLILIAGGSS